jgi:hypothetical protein
MYRSRPCKGAWSRLPVSASEPAGRNDHEETVGIESVDGLNLWKLFFELDVDRSGGVDGQHIVEFRPRHADIEALQDRMLAVGNPCHWVSIQAQRNGNITRAALAERILTLGG